MLGGPYFGVYEYSKYTVVWPDRRVWYFQQRRVPVRCDRSSFHYEFCHALILRSMDPTTYPSTTWLYFDKQLVDLYIKAAKIGFIWKEIMNLVATLPPPFNEPSLQET